MHWWPQSGCHTFADHLSDPGLEKKDRNPLAEVRWLCDEIMNQNNVLSSPPVAALKPHTSVTGLAAGDTFTLDVATFRRLAERFLAEIESRFPRGNAN